MQSVNILKMVRRLTGGMLVAILGVLTALVLVSHVAPHAGRTVFVIRGASMEPGIPLGSVILPARVAPEAITVGEIITIRATNGVIVTHRVIAVAQNDGERLFQLQGDANDNPDQTLVPANAVVGKVDAYVPVAGYLLALLSVPSGMLAVMSMLGALLLLNWLLEELESGQQPVPAAEELSPATA